MKKSISLTQEKKAELEQELAELIAERPAITERIATARAFGDLSENEDYSAARAEQKVCEGRILEIQDILKNAKIIRNVSRSKVSNGSKVSIDLAGKTFTYSIVDHVEADPLNAKISNASPLGKLIMNKTTGEDFDFNGRKCKILAVE